MAGHRDGGLHRRRPGPGEDIEHDVRADGPLIKRLGGGRLQRV